MILPDRSMKKSAMPAPERESSAPEAETAQSRSHMYLLLSALFIREVTPDLLKTLNTEEMLEGLHDLGVDMRKVIAPADERLINDLAEEYAALFIVPGGIPPYESVRLHGMLNQKPSWEVEEFYRRCGLVVKDGCRMLPDHLGMELEFMGYLAVKEADARRLGGEKEILKWSGFQAEFFQGHIRPWTFDFLQDMQKLAFHPFYKGIAGLAIRFLEADKEHLGLPDEEEGNRLQQEIINRVV